MEDFNFTSWTGLAKELVSLKEENYRLKKEVEELKRQLEELNPTPMKLDLISEGKNEQC